MSSDGESPTTELLYNGERLLAPATIETKAADEGAGVAATYWKVGSGRWTSGNTIRIDNAGAAVVEYYSVDLVGNIERIQSAVLDVAGVAGVPQDDDPVAAPIVGSDSQSGSTGESRPITPIDDQVESGSSGTYAFSSTPTPGLLVSPVMGASPAMSLGSMRLPSFDWIALWWPTDTSVALWAAVFAMFGAVAALTVRVPQTAAAYARGHGRVLQLSDFRLHG
ncbi:MAG: hypothetical protein Q8K99_00690 [Actinomycetota bacterium]|nr:hypothetical protein [Actinomycetota bacterium]